MKILKPGTRLNVFSIRRYGEGGEQTSWCLTGVAWVNRDCSINLKLDALPVSGELHLREPPKDKRDTTAEMQGAQPAAASSKPTNPQPLEAAEASASMGGH